MMYEHYEQNETPLAFLNLLITWGEAGVLKTHTKTTTKISDNVVPCNIVEYNVHLGLTCNTCGIQRQIEFIIQGMSYA